jgi:hypothetical protein
VAFVSTNSITQGEQVGILNHILTRKGFKIHFAHQTFKWSNEARGNAAVHVVILGFSNYDVKQKLLFTYESIKSNPSIEVVSHINGYLVAGPDISLIKRSTPICDVPEMNRGSDATDDGNLLLSEDEKVHLLTLYPECESHIERFYMGRELINNVKRYCLWLKGISPSQIKCWPEIYDRVQKVKIFRLASKRAQTKKAASFPSLFAEERQPVSDYLGIPKVSSETREYIPIVFLKKDDICGDKVFNVPSASLYHFGMLTSLMHNTWMRYTCGRMKSDYSYSNTIVYNNYPWPEAPSDKQKQIVEEAAQAVLDARAQFPKSSLADLYDPNTMPPVLVKAHQQLDKAVDLCYRPQPFTSEAKRIEYLFELYEKYTGGLFPTVKKTRQSKQKQII